MRSTGEVMGIDTTFGKAFFKAELAAGTLLPTEGTVFLSLADGDKPAGLVVAQRLRELGLGDRRHARARREYLGRFGLTVDQVVGKISDGHGINAVKLIESGQIAFVINTPQGRGGRTDGEQIRKAANSTTSARSPPSRPHWPRCRAWPRWSASEIAVRSLQEFHA